MKKGANHISTFDNHLYGIYEIIHLTLYRLGENNSCIFKNTQKCDKNILQ